MAAMRVYGVSEHQRHIIGVRSIKYRGPWVYSVRALLVRIGFWGTLYYNCTGTVIRNRIWEYLVQLHKDDDPNSKGPAASF